MFIHNPQLNVQLALHDSVVTFAKNSDSDQDRQNVGPDLRPDLDPNYLSRGMRFPTMGYVQPAKPQISLSVCAV